MDINHVKPYGYIEECVQRKCAELYDGIYDIIFRLRADTPIQYQMGKWESTGNEAKHDISDIDNQQSRSVGIL